MGLNNHDFLNVLKESFITYLKTSERSNKKLKVLHGEISKDIDKRFCDKKYSVSSLGYGVGKEKIIQGRYLNKAVDISILENEKEIAGIAVKFVMSNYSQNSNNYFENMLGETANLRSARIPYFQILVLPNRIPYFNKSGVIKKWERITNHNIEKYIKLSNDNIDYYLHTPNKTLIYIVDLTPEASELIKNKNDFINFYLHNKFEVTTSSLSFNFGDSIIYNNYERFANKVVYTVKSL